MSRAAALSQTLKKAIIPLILTIVHDNYKTIRLEIILNIGMTACPNNVKKKVQAFFCDNQDVEYILRTI